MVKQGAKSTSQKMGVLLCRCEEEIAQKVDLTKISNWLMEKHQTIIVKTAHALCKKPDEIGSFIVRNDLTHVIVGACKRYEKLFDDAAKKANLKPFRTKTVGLLEQCFIVRLEEHAEEKAKILLSAAISHQKQSTEIPSENLRFSTTPLHEKMDRRSFLTFPLKLRAKAIPTITHDLCMTMQGCNLCINACPKQAITEQKRKLQIDVSKCESCGICAATCPREAIFFPLYSLTQIDEEMRSLISANLGFFEPRILLFTCSGGVSLLSKMADIGLSYPANLMVIEVPCIGMVTPFIVLRAFDLGAAGLCLVSCQGRCQYGYNLNLLLEKVRITSKLLEILDIGPERVCAIIPTENDILEFYTQLKTFTEKVMQMEIHPLTGKKPSELKNLENRLSYLLKQIVSKLNVNKNVQVRDAKLPFGIVEVDAEKCSMCGLCERCCPTEALSLKDEEGHVTLSFNYNLCVMCGICLKRCPENAMHGERVLDVRKLDAPISILSGDKMVVCHMCGTTFTPERQIMIVSNRVSDKPVNYTRIISSYCPNCRAQISLQSIYRINQRRRENL